MYFVTQILTYAKFFFVRLIPFHLSRYVRFINFSRTQIVNFNLQKINRSAARAPLREDRKREISSIRRLQKRIKCEY